MDNLHKHLEFVQLTITRMGANSFFIKGWTVTLVAALFILSADNSDRSYMLLALIPAALFWGLDGYFLWQERRFRDIYNIVRKKPDNEIDFAMHYPEIENHDRGCLAAIFSTTLIVFHGSLFVAILTVYLIGECYGA